MVEQDISSIMAALCSTKAATDEEEYKTDEECDFENYHGDDYHGDDYFGDDDEDEDDRWDSFIDDTYNSNDEARTLSDYINKLRNIFGILEDEDYRYFPDEYSRLESAIEQLSEAVDELDTAAHDYIRFDDYEY